MANPTGGISRDTKNSDIANALGYIAATKYEHNLDKMLKDLNKQLKKKENQINKGRKKKIKYTLTKKQFEKWLMTKSEKIERKDRKALTIYTSNTDFKKIRKDKLDVVLKFANKKLSTGYKSYKSAFKFLFNIKKPGTSPEVAIGTSGAGVFAVSKDKVAKASKLKKTMMLMVKQLAQKGAINAAAPRPFRGNAWKKGDFTQDMAIAINRLIANPGAKSRITIRMGNKLIQYQISGSYTLYYCYRNQEEYTCFDYDKVDIGDWFD